MRIRVLARLCDAEDRTKMRASDNRRRRLGVFASEGASRTRAPHRGRAWRPTRRDLAIVGAAALPLLAPVLVSLRRRPSLVVREQPFRTRPSPFNGATSAVSDEVLALVRRALRWRPQMGLSHLLHWMRIFADPNSPEFNADRAADVTSLVTDVRRIEQQFGQPGMIVKTAEGIRFLSRLCGRELKAEAKTNHQFHELAVFGEVGLPSSTAVVSESGRFAVRDCLLSVQIREGKRIEPEWAMCVAAYYSASMVWVNRWGEEISLDGWAAFFLDREPTRFCCGGTHLLHSLALLLQLERAIGDAALSRGVADRVRTCCARFSQLLESSQHADGSWSTDWIQGPVLADKQHRQVQITGHVLEAQLYLREELRVAPSSISRGLAFLARALELASNDEVMSHYCPYSHAGRVLLLCTRGIAEPSLP
jgi:hypothetical protein